MLQVWRNFSPKTAKKPAFLTRFLLQAEPLHCGLLPQPPPPPVCTPPYQPNVIIWLLCMGNYFTLHCRNVHSARSAYKGMKRENRDEKIRITLNGGALAAKLPVAGSDGGVAAVADGGCSKKRKKGEEICRGWWWIITHGTVTSPGWIISPVHAAGLSPTQYKVVCVLFGSIPAQFCFGSGPFKNLQKKIHLQKHSWFSCIFFYPF